MTRQKIPYERFWTVDTPYTTLQPGQTEHDTLDEAVEEAQRRLMDNPKRPITIASWEKPA